MWRSLEFVTVSMGANSSGLQSGDRATLDAFLSRSAVAADSDSMHSVSRLADIPWQQRRGWTPQRDQ